jgi:hypothetical protein
MEVIRSHKQPDSNNNKLFRVFKALSLLIQIRNPLERDLASLELDAKILKKAYAHGAMRANHNNRSHNNNLVNNIKFSSLNSARQRALMKSTKEMFATISDRETA